MGDTARGLLMLRLTMASAMAATAMVDSTDMARGLLMLRLTMALAMAATAMVDSTDTARGLLMLRLTMALATAATAMVDSTDTARGPLMPTTEATAMAVLATAMALLATASNSIFEDKICQLNLKPKESSILNLYSRSQSVIRKIKL